MEHLVGSARTESRLKRATLSQQVSEYLLEQLRSGGLHPGDRLPTEHQLMDMFAVGRSSVREALHALVMMGLIEVRPGRGAVVTNATETSALSWSGFGEPLEWQVLSEFLEAREILETQLAALAADRGSAQEIDAIGQALQHHRFILDTHANRREIAVADMDFHQAIAQAAHNSALAKLLSFLTRAFSHLRITIVQHTGDSDQRILDQHQAIHDAVKVRDAVLARQAMLVHLETGKKLMEEECRGISGAS